MNNTMRVLIIVSLIGLSFCATAKINGGVSAANDGVKVGASGDVSGIFGLISGAFDGVSDGMKQMQGLAKSQLDILEKLGEILSGKAKNLINKFKEIEQQINNALMNAGKSGGKALEELSTEAVDVTNGLINEIETQISSLFQEGKALSTEAKKIFEKLIAAKQKIAQSLFDQLRKGTQKLRELREPIGDKLRKQFENAFSGAQFAIDDKIGVLKHKLDETKNKGSEAEQDLENAFKTKRDNLCDCGRDVSKDYSKSNGETKKELGKFLNKLRKQLQTASEQLGKAVKKGRKDLNESLERLTDLLKSLDVALNVNVSVNTNTKTSGNGNTGAGVSTGTNATANVAPNGTNATSVVSTNVNGTTSGKVTTGTTVPSTPVALPITTPVVTPVAKPIAVAPAKATANTGATAGANIKPVVKSA